MKKKGQNNGQTITIEAGHDCPKDDQCRNKAGSYVCDQGDGFWWVDGQKTDKNECLHFTAGMNCEQKCVNTNGSFKCECDAGFEVNGSGQCKDINECTASGAKKHKCGQNATCKNTSGSYTCTCKSGFTLNADGKTCKDINECAENTDNCHKNADCTNTSGSFTCKCKSGFSGNGVNCNDIDHCKNHDCGTGGTCVEKNNAATCVCDTGFELKNGKCVDINECNKKTDNCHKDATCTNTVGSFTCECKSGFSGNGVNCNDIDHCKNHDCGTGGTCVEKNNAATCVCDTGFELKNGKCVDINECNKKTDNCHKHADCTNTIGSFTCECKSGFSGDGVNCNDIDNCKNVDCGPGGKCVEKNNSPTCVCEAGFELKNGKCVDIDECARDIHNCHANADCSNTSGGFTCKCKSGFSGNGVNCKDIDQCKNVDCGSGGRCVEENNAPVCKCDPGFELKNGKCKDVNECNNGSHECDARATCTNTVGSYTCDCPTGFRNVNNGRQCDDINECSEQKDNCHNNANCINNEGSFTCKCKTGFSGDGVKKCDETDVCKGIDCGVHGNCVEKNGKGVCECDDGFELKNGQCVDINECQETGSKKHQCNDATCKNTIGSYVCICAPGTRLMADGKTCEDINECLEDMHNCHQNANCINTISSFNCQCKAGFNGDGVNKCDPTCSNIDCGDNSKCVTQNGESVCVCIDGFSKAKTLPFQCVDIDECADPLLNDCHVNADCTNTIGSYQCKCKTGFSGDGKINCSQDDPCMTLQCPDNSDCKNGQCVCHEGFSGPNCDDINECEPNPVAVCGNHATCHNYPGGFTCLCWPGYEEHESKLGCKDVDECARDLDDCGDHSYCTNVPGNYYCTCKTGFESVNDSDGAECDDIDECKVGNHNCDANASCTNTVGSYTCACNTGFVGNGRDCVETKDTCNPGCGENAHCQEKRIGQGRWARKQSTCKCNDGYQGDPLQGCVDTDECTANANPCDENEKCHNHDGGFKCKCAPGYERDSNGNCVNIDECSANNLNFCHSTKGLCFDYDGGYTCSCQVGYIGDGINCDDIDECAKGTDVCSTNAKCTNTIGSYECTCNPGFSGNGYECIQDEEETCNPTCGENSFCNGEKTCVCLAGYEMVNGKCIDIDECKRIRSGVAPTDVSRSMSLRLSQQTCNDPNSECLNLDGSFVCPCKAGFRLVNGICVNIDECDEGNHVCSKNAICNDLEGLYTCKCKDGFVGDGVICNENPCDHCGEASCNANGHCQCPKGYIYKNKKCIDVNECDAANSPCQANSACINTDGSFVCTCHFGYILQRGPDICVDLDECTLGTHQCHKDAKCSNYSGGYNCACKEGFKGNGLNCVDIDECELNMCGMNSICTNQIGSYECKCKDGYIPHPVGKDGKRIVCIPTVDPCSKGTHDCDANAFCQQDAKDPRGYVCKCRPGYGPLGDDQVGIPEKKCFDVDECETGLHNCSQVQECHNTIGSFVCLCPAGMEGDGLTCEDVNECELGIDQCSVHATCKNTIGSYQCICDKGFGGATCSDIDECALGYHQCHENAICHNNEGSYTCTCREHFIGDGIHKCVPGEDCPKDDPACDYHECTFGDPHFLFHQGDNERICFNYDGTLEHPMLLIGDDATGFYVTGRLEKAGKGSAFKEITIMTPGGVVAVFGKSGIKEYQNGMVVRSENGLHEQGFQSDDLIVQKMTGSNNWNVRVGSGIEIAIERRHVSFLPKIEIIIIVFYLFIINLF